MTRTMLAGLLLGVTAAAPAAAMEHSERIEHHSGAVDAEYRTTTAIAYDQVGMVAPGGRPSSLRCKWSVDLTVERAARHASGSTMARAISRDNVIEGSRPGWCRTQRESIAREVAQRTDELRSHMLAVAQEDRTVLGAEIDRLHGAPREG